MSRWVGLAAASRDSTAGREPIDNGDSTAVTSLRDAGTGLFDLPLAVYAAATGADPGRLRAAADAAATVGGRLAARAAERAGDLADAAARRAAHAPAMLRALDLVRDLIIERGRIVYGGTAIDYALRSRGRAMYGRDAIPDYDFYTPDAVGDAYDLVEKIGAAFGAELPQLRATVAIHATTTRVGFGVGGFVPLADIGAVPETVFASIPTLMHAGIRFVHMDFQRVDLHLSSMFPMANPPTEDAFNRARKDTARLALLDAVWPVTAPGGNKVGAGGVLTATLGGDVTAANGAAPTIAIGGYAAYGLLRSAYDDLVTACTAAGAPAPPPVDAPRLRVRVGARAVEAELPPGAAPALEFASCAAAAAAGPGARRRRAFLDAGFASFVSADGRAVVENVADHLLAVTAVLADGLADGGKNKAAAGRIRVAVLPPPGILRGFALAMVSAPSGAARDAARSAYVWTTAVVTAAEAACAAAGAAGAALFAVSPFGPGAGLLGGANRSSTYISSIRAAAETVGDVPAGNAEPRPANFHWRNGTGNRPPPFDYASSSHFNHDGGDDGLATAADAHGTCVKQAVGGTEPAAGLAPAAGTLAEEYRRSQPDTRAACTPPRFW